MPQFEFRADDLGRLRRLSFAARLPAMVKQEGQHRNRRAGEGLEFLDYRPYTVGDDLRHVDWNLYGRLRQLIVRVFEKQDNLSVSILVDTSRSMSFGVPTSKIAHACRIACALAHVALSSGERLSIVTFGTELGPILGPLQRKNDLGRVLEYLRQSQESQVTHFYDCVHALCARLRRRGLIIIISDFLTPEGYSRALRLLLSRGCKLLVIQVLDRLDLGSDLRGPLRIRDSETGDERVVFADETLHRQLARSAATYCEAMAGFCRTYHQHCVQTYTHDDYLELVCHAIRLGMDVR